MDPESAIGTSERIVHVVEVAIAYLLLLLLFVGLVDLLLVGASLVRSGAIADPTTLFELLNVVLLLFVIIEVYQTVLAYAREKDVQEVVRLIIIAGAVAIVRKVIVYQTSSYASISEALTAAIAYAVLLVGLAALLLANHWTRSPGSNVEERDDR
jgi:uncharacterized membrane protein (DUF373 family)